MTDRTPSAEDITYTTEALELASLLDHRVPRPDKARILAWSKQVCRHPNLERDDLLDAVEGFYDQPSAQPISVGDLVAGARRIKRDRIEKESRHEREARSDSLAHKAKDDDMQAISAGFLSGRVKDTPRLRAAREALDGAHGRESAVAAIREYFAAKREAKKPVTQERSS